MHIFSRQTILNKSKGLIPPFGADSAVCNNTRSHYMILGRLFSLLHRHTAVLLQSQPTIDTFLIQLLDVGTSRLPLFCCISSAQEQRSASVRQGWWRIWLHAASFFFGGGLLQVFETISCSLPLLALPDMPVRHHFFWVPHMHTNI